MLAMRVDLYKGLILLYLAEKAGKLIPVRPGQDDAMADG